MKKNLFLTLIFCGIVLFSMGQTFEIRTSEGDEGYLYVQMQETSGTGTPQTTDQVTDIVFQIKWLQSMGDVDMGSVICTNYDIVKSGSRASSGAYYYQEYFADNTPYAFPENWVQNTWVTIAKMEVGTGTGTGTFEIADDAFVPTGVNIGVNLVDNTPTVNGSATDFNFPTVVYDLVWTGASSAFWDNSGNWQTACGGSGSVPNTGNSCLIPVVATVYPTDFFAASFSHQPFCDNLRISAGASLTIKNVDALSTQLTYTVNDDLFVDGSLNIMPDGQLTVTGSTNINSATGIIIQSTATGTGSFIDNGTITYGASGSAKVQTYLSNSAGSGNFDIHLVGPTVDEENYTGAGTGAYLSAFNVVNGSTYAYSWDETQVLLNGWQNINSLSYEVRTADGIGLSTIDNLPHTLEMTGSLMTGAISSPALTFSNNHYELISNPYPSSIDFDGLATDNSGVANDAYWIWDPAANNYVERAGGVGGTQYIQVGQGFFVETNSTGTFNFSNARRAHSTVAFRETMTNMLSVTSEGGKPGYRDDAIIRFDEQATSGYDVNMEAVFWESQNSDATSLRSVAESNLELAINALPLESLTGGEMLSVPLNFDCGYTTEYSLTFTDIETFEAGTEIWLEDKQIGGDWISVNNQPEYHFTGSPDDAADRFILHFFGPTGTDEITKPTVDLYSFGQYAYVRNNTDETILEVRVYSLSGSLVRMMKTTDQKFLKLYVGDQMAYYVIRVVTDQQVYTEKIFINK
ncbi:MAG: T9SS type A sorting domain-containing protein [Bacteroidales bacterium]|jgi:hypothetical protein